MAGPQEQGLGQVLGAWGWGSSPGQTTWASGSPGGTSWLLPTFCLRLFCVEILGQESGCFLGLAVDAAWGPPARVCAPLPGAAGWGGVKWNK